MSGIFDQVINYAPPSLLLGTVTYKGSWSAATNTPTLPNPPSSITNGNYYVVSAAGTQFSLSFNIGDWIISNGSAWEKVDNTDAVSSVFGRTGAVVGVSTDYSAVGITATAVGASSPSTGAFTTLSATTPLAVASGGTGVASSTGTTNVVLSGSPTITTPVIAQINDANGNETLKLASIASAVNEVTIENAATGNAVHISATGGDASVGLHLAGKGASGYVNVQDSTDATKRIMFNAAGGTTNTRTMLSSTQTVDRTLSLPDATDTLVGKATTDTLTNKTLTSPTITGGALNGTLGATTPSSVAATTGTFSSTLGVTGVATLGNGAILGTPASGLVTNLTGTASININGTVGATTPSTVAGTTGTFTADTSGTILGVRNSAAGATKYTRFSLGNDSSATIAELYTFSSTFTPSAWEKSSGMGVFSGGSGGLSLVSQSGDVRILAGSLSTVHGLFTSTGLNSTAIGATTPSTGAFTTISGTTGTFTGAVTIGGTAQLTGSAPKLEIYHATAVKHNINGSDILSVSGTGAAITGALSASTLNIGSAPNANSRAWALQGFGYINGAGGNGIEWRNSTTGNSSYITNDIDKFYFNSLGGIVVSQGGAEITGTLSATGNLTLNNATVYGMKDTGGTLRALIQLYSDNNVYIDNSATGGSNILTRIAGSTITQHSSTGLAVTGQVTTTDKVGIGSGGSADGELYIGFNGSALYGINVTDSNNASSASFLTFRKANNSGIGGVSRVGATDAVVYNTTSDARLKENLRDFTDSGRLIDALKPRVFDWKDSDSNGKDVIGFIAQEEHAADPMFAHIGAITVGDDDPTTIIKQWQRSDAALIPILVAELQSLRKRLAALESK